MTARQMYNTAAVDPEFLKIFDLKFRAGASHRRSTSAHSAIITERTTERIVRHPGGAGRRILLQNDVEVTVTGVIRGRSRNPRTWPTVTSSMLKLRHPGADAAAEGDEPPPASACRFDPDNDLAWALDSFLTYLRVSG